MIDGVPSEQHIPQPERIEIAGKTLIIPPEIQGKMTAMDNVIAENGQASEVLGFGLTRELPDGSLEMADFIFPDPENIFNFNSLFLTKGQVRLGEILSNSGSLSLQIEDDQVILVPDGSTDKTRWMRIDLNGVDFVKTQINELLGFEMPKSIEELKAAIERFKQEKGLEGGNDSLPLKSDWDYVVSGGSVSISPRFLDKVRMQAQKMGAEIGFSSHHHPSLGLLALLIQDKPLHVRQEAYDTVLKYSEADLRTHEALGIDFFQIRAFGNLNSPFNPDAGVTVRNYRVSDILRSAGN